MSEPKKVALVTGASSGIGRAIAIGLAAKERPVVVNYNNNAKGAEETVAMIEATGGEAYAIQADVSDYKAVERMFAEANSHYGSVDILVNNAGVLRDSLLLRMSWDDLDTVINTNLKSVFYCSKQVLRTMIKKRWGRIVNISSLITRAGNPGQTNYSASKGGVDAFTRSLAKEVGSRNITVNAISAGYIKTKISEVIAPEFLKLIINASSVRRLGEAREVAALAIFLASEDASFVTGSVISADGGVGG